jgi:plastocyanin
MNLIFNLFNITTMKTKLLLATFALFSGISFGATITITNSGFTFSPDNVSINEGDIVNFQLGGAHNAVEVSEATWMANGATPLPGFSVPFGGGQVLELTPGIHFYVCTAHVSGGMKGRITVNPQSGIGDDENIPSFKLFPNPTSGKFTLQTGSSGSAPAQPLMAEELASLEIFDLLGNSIYSLKDFNPGTDGEIDISSVPNGIYVVRINDRKKMYSIKLAKN